MKNNLSDEDYKAHIWHVGEVMGSSIESSIVLHKLFPDNISRELDPRHDPGS